MPDGKHEAYSPSGARQLQRALDEQLIAVDVRSAFDPIYARLANEVGNTARMKPSAGPHVCHAAVTAQHVPRGIADHGVKARSGEWVSLLVRKHFRECQRPVEEAVPRRQCGRMVQKALCQAIGQGSRSMQQAVAQLAENSRRRRASVLPEPACTPEIQHRRPAAKRGLRRMEGRKCLGLFRDDRRRVVWLKGQLQARACGVLQCGRQIRIRKQR